MIATNDELVDLIYAALLGEASWDMFMDRLSGEATDGWATLVSHDALKGGGMLGHYYGCDDTLVHDYESHFAAINPWAPQCVVRREGLAVTGDDLIARDHFVRTEFFNDFLLPYNTQDVAGISIVKNENRAIMLSVLMADADPDTTSRLAHRLAFLYPHLRRAADYYRRGQKRDNSLGLGAALFDATDIGLVIVGEDLRPKTVSDSGMAMMSGRRGLGLTPVGRLRLDDEGAQKLLGDMLAYGYAGPKTATFVVGDLKLTLVHIVKDRISWYFEGPTVAILIEPVSRNGKPFDPDFFAATYRLTRAEMRALDGVIAGKTIDAIAAGAGVSRETVRSQLKSLYFKTGVHNQSGLLRLVHAPRPDSGQ